MTTDENVPTIEELQDQGVSLREALDPEASATPQITIQLSPDEYELIGGKDSDLWELSIKVSDFVNSYISSLNS